MDVPKHSLLLRKRHISQHRSRLLVQFSFIYIVQNHNNCHLRPPQRCRPIQASYNLVGEPGAGSLAGDLILGQGFVRSRKSFVKSLDLQRKLLHSHLIKTFILLAVPHLCIAYSFLRLFSFIAQWRHKISICQTTFIRLNLSPMESFRGGSSLALSQVEHYALKVSELSFILFILQWEIVWEPRWRETSSQTSTTRLLSSCTTVSQPDAPELRHYSLSMLLDL